MTSHSKPKLDEGLKDKLKVLTFDQQRVVIGIFLRSTSGSRLWDLITGQRGPDTPSETPSMSGNEASVAYSGRRSRKYDSTEVIRQAAWFGIVGGAARSHIDDHIKLPPRNKHDHFDRHMEKAANAIGLKINIIDDKESGF